NVTEIARPERIGKHLVDRADSGDGLQQHPRHRMLIQKLTAPAAGHDGLSVAVHTDEGDELTAPGHVQVADECALSAETDPVGGVLDVVSCDDPSVADERRSSHPVARVR